VEYIVNDYIKADFEWAHTLKIGGEIKVTPQFALRAGFMTQTSPMKLDLTENLVEVFPAGTIPHFNTISKPTNYYSIGFGYRFTPNFYVDMACVHRYNNSKAYAFSGTNMYDSDEEAVISIPASLKTKSTRFLMTLGYKF
jgi:long-subunit fatty acid transport protein